MQILNNIKTYKKYYPNYLDFEKKQEEKEAKRNAYLEKHPELLKEEEIERNKLIFQSINLLDKYTTQNSEDVEVATEIIKDQAVSLSTIGGTGIAFLISKIPLVSKKLQNLSQNHPKLGKIIPILPSLTGLISSLVISIPIIKWNANKEFKAATQGRIEAMQNLKSPNHFAKLTPEQKNEIETIARTIEIEKKEKPPAKLGIISNFKMLKENEEQFDMEREERHRKREECLKTHEIRKKTPSEIEQEKKDEKVIIQLLQKIDMETERSAKHVGILANIAHLAVIGSGFLTGWITNNILANSSLLKNPQSKTIIPFVTGGLTAVYTSLWASKVAKKTAKMERQKVKEEMLKHPENFIYVDESLYQNALPLPMNKNSKTSPKVLGNTIKEYINFNNQKNLTRKNTLKKRLATEKIAISEEQKKDANNLKRTIFKTFYKIDNKEQSFKESVEAVGESIMLPVELGTMGLAGLLMESKKLPAKIKIPLSLSMAIIPNILLEYWMTEEQDKASKVANMLAIQTMEKEESPSV